MESSIYFVSHRHGDCELSVQKILFNTDSPKTIVYSFKPFTGKLFRLCR